MSPYTNPAQMLNATGVAAQAQSIGCKVWSLASELDTSRLFSSETDRDLQNSSAYSAC